MTEGAVRTDKQRVACNIGGALGALGALLYCLHLFIYCFNYFTVNAQFFGTGSSRLEDTQEIPKDMAQEYKEIIEDKE